MSYYNWGFVVFLISSIIIFLFTIKNMSDYSDGERIVTSLFIALLGGVCLMVLVNNLTGYY